MASWRVRGHRLRNTVYCTDEIFGRTYAPNHIENGVGAARSPPWGRRPLDRADGVGATRPVPPAAHAALAARELPPQLSAQAASWSTGSLRP